MAQRKPVWDRRGPGHPFPVINKLDKGRYKFLFSTDEWLSEVKASYQRCVERDRRGNPYDMDTAIKKEARLQCAKDWKRMTIEDCRSYRKIAQDYLLGNELLDFFGSQTCMARIFELLMACFPSFLITQCGSCAFKMIVYNNTLALYKRFLIWHPKKLGKPRGTIDTCLYVGPVNIRLDCKTTSL